MSLRLNRFAFLIGLAVVACGEDDAPSPTAARRDSGVDSSKASGGGLGEGGSGGIPTDAAGDRALTAAGGGDASVPVEDAANGGAGGTPRDAAMEHSGGATGGRGGASGAATGGQSGGVSTDAGAGGFDGSTGAAIACTTDASCAAGSICVVGHCVEGDCATDSACPPGQICGRAAPFSCAPCLSDSDCRADPAYGPSTICVAGTCIAGNCHADTDCPAAGICGLTVSNVCAACAADADCSSAFGYGPGYVCASGACVKATCAADGDCGPGQICGLVAANVCAPCATDAACRTDPGYGPSTVCVAGACSVGDCHEASSCAPGFVCSAAHMCRQCVSTEECRGDPDYGARTVCAAGACTPGNCAGSADCTGGQICGVANPNYCGVCTTDGDCKNDPAYGPNSICVIGACVAGDCEHDADCSTGGLCGVDAPYVCGPCSVDTECQNDPTYGSSDVCNPTTGKCVAGACADNGRACAENHQDFCCDGACVHGNCCVDSDCDPLGKSLACVGNVCTSCPAPTGTTFIVDPNGGDDAMGTGASTPKCAFKTVTRALEFIGSSASANTKIEVLPTGPVSAGEVFPIVVPENVTVSGSGGKARVLVRPNAVGFVLKHAWSALANLVIDGQAAAALTGVLVTTGSNAATSIGNVDVAHFSGDGIRVEGQGMLVVERAVTSVDNGAANGSDAGLHVTGKASVILDVTSGSGAHFDGNAANGIVVGGTASLTLTGQPGTGSSGTVTTNANGRDGLFVSQTPLGSPLPQNAVKGLVSVANQRNGIAITGGSNVSVRASRSLANGANGVLVTTYVVGPVRNDGVSTVDLGQSTDPGESVFQTSLDDGPNLGAGICLALDRTAGQVLAAAGNVFAGPTDCATTASSLIKSEACTNAVDIAVSGGLPTSNSITVSQCK